MTKFALSSSALLLAFSIAGPAASQGQAISYKDQPKLHDIATAPSAENLRNDVQTLVDFGTRHTLSETESDTQGIGAARRWIFEEFERISAACGGCLEVYYSTGVIAGEARIPDATEVVSVVAIQRGKTDPERYVLMAGDIDSRATDVMDSTSAAPGANDNASGVAGTMEAARVLSQYEFHGSIVYAALSGEEQGLFGGQILAEQALEEGWRLHAVLNNDMIGNIAGINGVIDNTTARVFAEGTRQNETAADARMRRFTGGEVDSPSRNLGRYISWMADRYIPNLDVMVIYRLDRFGRGGHHRPFNDVGYPGVRIMETNEHYDRQHQDLRNENGRHFGDTIEYVDFDYAAKLTALNAVTLASMAWAPAPPSEVSIRGAVQPDTTLSWAPASEQEQDMIAGYRIYWRYTDAPNWQFSRDVGNVTEFTLENVVIDNYFFGVSSVSKDGFESPVVFPGAAGTFDLR
ncbi:peptidase M28 [Aliidiomarina iranensis]|uniref:Peptidase M28 n=1 Tax=Aliidiomarina iranensis TaxID=1434071 RepID=A0A432VVF8_9GAMM|nr:peptidase M28 [Aliidiomarina iranensis]